jgi:hypothetical protein
MDLDFGQPEVAGFKKCSQKLTKKPPKNRNVKHPTVLDLQRDIPVNSFSGLFFLVVLCLCQLSKYVRQSVERSHVNAIDGDNMSMPSGLGSLPYHRLIQEHVLLLSKLLEEEAFRGPFHLGPC